MHQFFTAGQGNQSGSRYLKAPGVSCEVDGRPLIVGSEYLWPGRFHEQLPISTGQYARISRDWGPSIGLEATAYETHSRRRTTGAHIYKRTRDLRAVQLLLGHTKADSTVQYLRVELGDALAIAEAIEI